MSFSAKMQPQQPNGVASMIKALGYKAALDLAFSRALVDGITAAEVQRYMKLSRAMMVEARSAECSEVVFARYCLLAKFYRHLAHKMYWSLPETTPTQKEFLQAL